MLEFKRSQRYAQIAPDEETTPEKGHCTNRCSIAYVVLVITLAISLIAGMLALHYQREHESPTECGASLAEFEANECVFDLLSYNWMPPRCKDHATSKEFDSWLSDPKRNMGPWPFFKNNTRSVTDANNRITSDQDFGERWDMEIWASMEEHLAHCMFLFLHVSRVALGEAPLRTSDTLPHAEHCFHAIWKGLNGTWDINDDWRANQRIEIETTTC